MAQVDPWHYSSESYDTFQRWASYWYQIQEIVSLRPHRVLEIGPGPGVLTWYLRERLRLEVVTLDGDARLGPDLTLDVRELSSRLPPSSFDLVCAFQVLEHLPYADLPNVLRQLAHATRRDVLISLPENGHTLQLRAHVWRLQLALGRKIGFRRKWKFNGEHYWEVGTRGHEPEHVRSALKEQFRIRREFSCPDNPYHRFYSLVKHERL